MSMQHGYQPDGGQVVAVSSNPEHALSKIRRNEIRLLAGLGVEGDAHAGATVQHRSRVPRDPSQPNLRQVHLLQAELLDELARDGRPVQAGEMGENVTTRGVDLLGLPSTTRLRLGADAVVEVTGLRNPCAQLDGLYPGLMQAVLGRDPEGGLVRRAGVMAIVIESGTVRPGDSVVVELPASPHGRLEPV
ncbi:MAG: MOSC domain-containing protein [Vulcanimicrobiota bacterium]